MGRPPAFDHAEARARIAAGVTPKRAARQFGVTVSAIYKALNPQAPRPYRPTGIDRRRQRPNPVLLAALGVDGRDPVRAARAAALSARIRRLHAEARASGALPWGPLQAASAHEAGLTLDEIDEIYAVPPVEAVRAIAAHVGR